MLAYSRHHALVCSTPLVWSDLAGVVLAGAGCNVYCNGHVLNPNSVDITAHNPEVTKGGVHTFLHLVRMHDFTCVVY